jgi:cellulose synthase (UDP-forming)
MPALKYLHLKTSSAIRTLLWVSFLGAYGFLSTIPASYTTQAIVSIVLLSILFGCYKASPYVKSIRGADTLRLTIVFISGFLALRYMYWRATDTLPLEFGIVSFVCGFLLFFAELYGFLNMVLGYVINVRPRDRTSIPLPNDPALVPSVDVYIPTYNEDPAIVRTTVIAATQMRYAKGKLHVYILDDGGTQQKLNDKDPVKAQAARERSAELRQMARVFGAGYITRAKNEHAKAGNLNNALQHTHGELLLILDCDHIPTEDFVVNTAGFFLRDPKLFLVQTPHNFVSPDPVERNLNTFRTSPAENELFYNVMQPGLDFWGTSFFCGSAAILRRSVLNEVGGIAGQTITEDAETTLDALALGYTTLYYPRPMVCGLQPETYSGFIVQRVRWGQGMMQIFLLKNPLLLRGLTLMQRVLYLNFAFFSGFSLARFILLLAPPAYILFDVNLCDATPEALITYAAPSLVGALISTQYFYGRVRWPFISQIYEVIQSVYVLPSIAQVLRRPRSPSFKVTPKGEVLDKDFLSSLSKPFYFFLLLNLVTLFAGIDRYMDEPGSRGTITFVGLWALLDCVLLLCALGSMYERKQVRAEPRIPHTEPVQVIGADLPAISAVTVNASASGISLVLDKPQNFPQLKAGDRFMLAFLQRDTCLCGVVRSVSPGEGNSVHLGFSYEFRSPADERAAIRIAFGSSEKLIRNNSRRHGGRTTPTAFLYLVKYAIQYGFSHLYLLFANLLVRLASFTQRS